MAEAYTTSQQDLRTFGTQQQRLLDDLNRPDLSTIALEYLQDAMRFWQRKPFFFSEIDNKTVPSWAASTIYPQGSTIQFVSAGTTYIAVALNQGTSSSGGAPAFPTTIFTIPTSGLPPPVSGTAGTVDDNGGPPTGIRWATVASVPAGTTSIWTNLSTVYRINQYVPPIDYVRPKTVQITTANLRLLLEWISFEELSSYDVIIPAPINAYPRMVSWFQQQLYLWVYPSGFFPITLNYRTGPQLVTAPGNSNFWTTQGERLIRKYAQAAIEREVLHDFDAADKSDVAWAQELSMLRSQAIGQQPGGIPASEW